MKTVYINRVGNKFRRARFAEANMNKVQQVAPPEMADGKPVQTNNLDKVRLKRPFWEKYPRIVFILIVVAFGSYFLLRSNASPTAQTHVWDTNDQWNTGTLSNVVVGNNTVTLASVSPSNVNLAYKVPVVASSLQSRGHKYAAAYAVDGNYNTRWSSQFSDPQWLYVNLGSTYVINRVSIDFETAYASSYSIQVSDNAVNWTTIYSTNSGYAGVNNITGLNGAGRFVRVYCTKRGTQWGDSIIELAVYGAPAASATGASYVSSGTITLDYNASAAVSWASITPVSTLPSGTNITYQERTSSDNATWSAWTSTVADLAVSQYIQIQASLSTTNATLTPTLSELTLTYTISAPSPTVSITASPASITSGSTSIITWSSTNTTACTATGAWSGAESTSGSVTTAALSASSTYNIACTGSGGSADASTTVAVTAPVTPSPSSSGLFPYSMFDSGQVQSWPVDVNSSTFAKDFVTDYENNYGSVGVNTMPMYTVTTNTPTVTMGVSSGCNNFLSNTGTSIPIPSFAASNGSSDNPMAIYQPSTNSIWEFWQASSQSVSNWTACWGGLIKPNTTSSGVFTSPFGLSATGISYYATAITEADVKSGVIAHAISVDLTPNCNTFIYPADRGDCSSHSGQPSEGSYFRFPTSINCASQANPFADMVCTAIQKYGMVVTDQAGAVMLEAEQPSDWAAEGNSGTDPITTSWQGNQEYQVVANLPWSSLQVVDPPNPYTP